MDYDGITDSNRKMDIESTSSDDQLLVRILQFGKELHALKQQLNTEYGESTQNDKMLQVQISVRHGSIFCDPTRPELRKIRPYPSSKSFS
jgi:hypothetical protein